MSTMTTVIPLIEETARGPSIAGTRITIYSVMDCLKLGLSRNYAKASFRISDEELDAVIEYIEQHKEQVERDYERILRRSEELQERYRKIQLERSPFPPDLPLKERKKLMVEKIRKMKETGGFYSAAALAEKGSAPQEAAPRQLDDHEICMAAYLALDYLENDEWEKLPQALSVIPEDLEKVYQYIAEHKEEMERDKELIRRGLY
ncbi:MAG: hypothetical protein MOB07_20805 [Acidobacteria bacterium]|nr:hypothetical protein [Acidobacteriota bacterium]